MRLIFILASLYSSRTKFRLKYFQEPSKKGRRSWCLPIWVFLILLQGSYWFLHFWAIYCLKYIKVVINCSTHGNDSVVLYGRDDKIKLSLADIIKVFCEFYCFKVLSKLVPILIANDFISILCKMGEFRRRCNAYYICFSLLEQMA